MKIIKNRSVLMGAAFLMATSAIGPGFLTQTTVFTQSLGASFGFVILTSIIIDIGVQLNIWRVIAVSEKRAQDIANILLPGLGGFISLLIVLGGLAFNIGNIAGAGLGLQALLGVSVTTGAVISAALAIAIFMIREAGKAMDRFAQVMGFIMIIVIIYIAITSAPPVGEAALRTFVPLKIDLVTIVTLVGGTVGGYITFSGGHRLLDAGIKGKEALQEVSTSAVMGISVASLVRIFLFLASLGVISKGLAIDAGNPTASVFQLAAGEIGYRLFGLVMFSAAVTSVIGSAYTSVSFVKSFSPKIAKNENKVIIAFILVSTVIFILVGKPIKLLILAGVVNGFILPITLATILFAAYKTRIVGDYKHPVWLTCFGVLVVLIMTFMSGKVLFGMIS
ncbi:Mn2+ and Fe2+ transporters of the NRAMP family [Pedobacter steynii]|uniref:Mn2+ and Fe2+ transporters of the NRAMP family n=1 Tax=Pedobacter steynii TaxID=430522 RepID=A0A1G9N1A8_9SPHI|nr:NRAMP family divalent metal transporter [Pedobacter steynii]NQX39451.1 divalent metal cation transporter [Pedobacter steynii]SDL79645.1 Mn2+ and Fe2+ transporters of the NRAMP family [Pedobacter steynii]